ncbi:carbohydrate ABC transporter permease [Clostridium sp.]|uniref:carbohydrate ABC transporter permease n=1 Tax=Clostridium sp. TaxID=1506 RepID=UPI00261DCE05|nr:carbohydrate ABC transporter permease [uncultured Clostridium sp.]
MATINISRKNNSSHFNENKFKKILVNIILYGILLIGSIIVLYPFFFLIMNSFKLGPEIMNSPLALPKSINFGGYTEVFKSLNIPRLFFNTIFIASSVTALNVLFSSMVAYAIVKLDVPFKSLTRNIILASMMIPSVLLLIPTYTMLYNWNWINTYRVLIIPMALSAYNIFLMIQFFTQIDDAYLEAARIDGANEFMIFNKVVLPMAKPALATISILAFMGSWNDFLNPLLYLRSDTKMTLQIAIYKFSNAIPGVHVEQLWAAMVLVSLPIVIIYFCMQKNFVKAFTGVGLK